MPTKKVVAKQTAPAKEAAPVKRPAAAKKVTKKFGPKPIIPVTQT
jgi:hypothetical protein